MFLKLIEKQNPSPMSHLETKILGTIVMDGADWKELGCGFRGGWAWARHDLAQVSATPVSWVERAQVPGPAPDAAAALRCVVLKLASLGMFFFSLGQTILCIGRNNTSCESYGYDACDYQVADGSIRACPFCAPPLSSPCPFEALVPPQVSPQGEALGRATTPQPTTRGAIHTTLRPGGWRSGLWGFPAHILLSKPEL